MADKIVTEPDMAKTNQTPEQVTISRNSRITIAAALAMVLAAASSVWWISGVINGLKQDNQETKNDITEAVEELGRKMAETSRRVTEIESYNETIYRRRFTRDHAEIWWLRSERENTQGTGLIDPRLIFDDGGNGR